MNCKNCKNMLLSTNHYQNGEIIYIFYENKKLNYSKSIKFTNLSISPFSLTGDFFTLSPTLVSLLELFGGLFLGSFLILLGLDLSLFLSFSG